MPNGDLVEYLVDGAGRRVAKKLNGVVTKQWIYRDALKPVAELDGSGALVAQFVYGSKGNVPDYVRRGGNTYRVVSDHLGSPRYVVNVANSGDVPFTANYSAFGSVTGTGLDWMPFGFAGGIYDPDTQLTRFGARDYDALVSRWTAKDPVLLDGGLNLYGYAISDPVNFVDRTGRGPELAAGGAATAPLLGLGIGAAICWAVPACRQAVENLMKDLFADDVPTPANDNALPHNDVEPLRDVPNYDDCEGQRTLCVSYPWQPDWNCENYGPRKDCLSCYIECRTSGRWPEYKCPVPR